MPRDYYLMPEFYQAYIVEFELNQIFKQLKQLNLNTQRTLETLAAGLLPHDMTLAVSFIENMFIVNEFFRGRAEKSALVRHIWLGGIGITRTRQISGSSQKFVYSVLIKWEEELKKANYVPTMQYLLSDRLFMQNLDSLLKTFKTFEGDYNVRTNVQTNKGGNFGKDEEERTYGN